MIVNDERYLEHYGVLGMHWGVRKDDYSGASKKTNKEARKDAEEFARAKMYFGKGAGTRRKLIRETVASKKNRSESYSKAFDHHLARQDFGEHTEKAISERKRTDRKESVRKTTGAVARRLTGEWGTAAAFVALAAGGAALIQRPDIRAKMMTQYRRIMDRRPRQTAEDILKRHGIM